MSLSPPVDATTRWTTFAAVDGPHGPADVAARQREADRLVEAEGASYLFHDVGRDISRPWRLDQLPIVLTGTEWAALETAIVRRVRVLERLIADCYGGRALLRAGTMPPEALFATNAFARPAVGARPTRWLTTYAADIVLLASGEWRVLRDLTDAPVGAGYALVNRTVSAQLAPNAMRAMAPVSLAPFFAAMRSALDATAPSDRTSPRTVVLTSGPGDPSYFEHSYLAAHLGYHLAEPADLVVRNGKVWLRALSGLEQIDVLLRRVDGEAVDALESGRGAIGVPGLARAFRDGLVGFANALGAGVGSAMTLAPFIDTVAASFGEAGALPTMRTLWCGDAVSRDEVLADLTRFVLYDTAAGDRINGVSSPALGWLLAPHDTVSWRRLIDLDPHRVVAQERAQMATASTFSIHGSSEAVVLRVHAVIGRDGITLLPGGLARVIDRTAASAGQATGFTKDVWVLDDRAERPLPIATRIARSMPQVDLRESLPTRTAEAMYWVGRHAERAEALARSAAAALTLVQNDPTLLDADDGAWRRPVVAALRALTGSLADPNDGATDDFRRVIDAVLVDAGGLPGALAGLSRSASSARQFLSATTWRVLGELEHENAELGPDVVRAFDAGVRRRLDTVLVHLSSLAGLFNDSTVRGPAWRFLEIGRRVERAMNLLSMFDHVVSPAPVGLRDATFEYVLAVNESLVAYRRRYRSDVVLDALVDLLVLDDANPRSLAYQLDQLRQQATLLPYRDGVRQLTEAIERSSAALVEMSWLPATADQPDDRGRRAVIDRFVLDVRGPVLEVATMFNQIYFNDPTRSRQRIGGV